MTTGRPGRSARVLCVGVITLDHVYSVTTPITPGVKHRASARRDVGGGVAANAAVAISRLGGHAHLLGAVGTDSTGDAVLEELRREHVDVSGVRRIDDAATTESVVLIEPDGSRTIVAHAEIDLVRLDGVDPGPEPYDAVLVDARWPATTRLALGAARRMSVPGVVDVDRGPATAEERDVLLATASHLVCSEVGLLELTGVADTSDALRLLADSTDASVSVTLGGDGVRWVERDGDDLRIHHQPAFAVETVDTTGAGDVFHGAFALALAEGRELADAFEFASAVAALKCARPGARAGIPARAEADALLAERRPGPSPSAPNCSR